MAAAPLLMGLITAQEDSWAWKSETRLSSVPQGPVFPAGFGEATYLGWASPAFSASVPPKQFQLSAMVHSTLPSIPGLLSGAGLSGPWRSPVTGQGVKSLFAKPSTSFWPYP